MLLVLLLKGRPSVLRSNLCTDLSADIGSIFTVAAYRIEEWVSISKQQYKRNYAHDERDRLLRLTGGFVVVTSFSIRFLMVKCGFSLMYGFSSKAGCRYRVSNGKKLIFVVSTAVTSSQF